MKLFDFTSEQNPLSTLYISFHPHNNSVKLCDITVDSLV